jgi:hypothetical protein
MAQRDGVADADGVCGRDQLASVALRWRGEPAGCWCLLVFNRCAHVECVATRQVAQYVLCSGAPVKETHCCCTGLYRRQDVSADCAVRQGSPAGCYRVPWQTAYALCTLSGNMARREPRSSVALRHCLAVCSVWMQSAQM